MDVFEIQNECLMLILCKPAYFIASSRRPFSLLQSTRSEKINFLFLYIFFALYFLGLKVTKKVTVPIPTVLGSKSTETVPKLLKFESTDTGTEVK